MKLPFDGSLAFTAASALLALAAIVSVFLGWQLKSDAIFMSVLVSGLPGCFGI
ncbi:MULTISPECIES: hypothetical protein [Afifella]|uniref:hypothetical protein n=1 Tax=Afifella TaxID=643217 RepID=UPI0013E3E323|nr:MULTISPECIES: hypothetical protein [Afifella]MCT8268208.1 hypothetical protein [Afifella sp. JA880]